MILYIKLTVKIIILTLKIISFKKTIDNLTLRIYNLLNANDN